MRRMLLSLLALALGASGAAAQSMRPFSTYRQWHGETRLELQTTTAERATGAPPRGRLRGWGR